MICSDSLEYKLEYSLSKMSKIESREKCLERRKNLAYSNALEKHILATSISVAV